MNETNNMGTFNQNGNDDDLDQLSQSILNSENNDKDLSVIENKEIKKRTKESNLNFLPPILRELTKNSIQYHFLPNGDISLGSFFKKGVCLLRFEDNNIILVDKKKNEQSISDIRDLIYFYYNAWKDAFEKKNAEPDPDWLNLMIKENLVEKTVIYKPII